MSFRTVTKVQVRDIFTLFHLKCNLVMTSKELVLKKHYFALYLVAVTFVSTCVCVCLCAHARAYVCVCLCAHARAYGCLHMRLCGCLHVHLCGCVHARVCGSSLGWWVHGVKCMYHIFSNLICTVFMVLEG
jgi:hypothetical protein